MKALITNAPSLFRAIWTVTSAVWTFLFGSSLSQVVFTAAKVAVLILVSELFYRCCKKTDTPSLLLRTAVWVAKQGARVTGSCLRGLYLIVEGKRNVESRKR
ncbi:MAG: hypothetical protein U0R49_11475 [Fimbriimonadales bacterium]